MKSSTKPHVHTFLNVDLHFKGAFSYFCECCVKFERKFHKFSWDRSEASVSYTLNVCPENIIFRTCMKRYSVCMQIQHFLLKNKINFTYVPPITLSHHTQKCLPTKVTQCVWFEMRNCQNISTFKEFCITFFFYLFLNPKLYIATSATLLRRRQQHYSAVVSNTTLPSSATLLRRCQFNFFLWSLSSFISNSKEF